MNDGLSLTFQDKPDLPRTTYHWQLPAGREATICLYLEWEYHNPHPLHEVVVVVLSCPSVSGMARAPRY